MASTACSSAARAGAVSASATASAAASVVSMRIITSCYRLASFDYALRAPLRMRGIEKCPHPERSGAQSKGAPKFVRSPSASSAAARENVGAVEPAQGGVGIGVEERQRAAQLDHVARELQIVERGDL